MIIEAATVPADTTLTADVCIIGAGAVGISLALALMESGVDVLLLEGGHEADDAPTQDLYAGTVADERLHSPPDRYRQRRFGGSTTIWGGRCMPFDPMDFQRRDFIAESGWPIGYDEVLPFYPAANRLCEAGDFAYTVEEAFPKPAPELIVGLPSSSAFSSNTLERFSCPTDFGKRYRRRLSQGPCRVVLGANVRNMLLDASGRRLDHLEVRTLAGNRFRARARRYVMAVGGLETARMLLASPGATGRGIGNGHDVVGRYYMCHLAGTIGTLDLAPAAGVWHGYAVSDEGIYCRRRLALRPEAQQRLRVGSFIARLHHPRLTDPAHRTGILSLLCLAGPWIPYEYAKRLTGGESTSWQSWLAHVGNVLRDIPGITAFLWHWLRHRTLAERKFPSVVVHPKAPRYSLDFHAEQEPNPESRVTLAPDATDALGMPRLRVDWRYTRQDIRTVQAALAVLAHDIAEGGVGRFVYNPAEVEHEMTRYGAYGGHHIGTARMGSDPRNSVVDGDCRVHEVDNLYVAGSAVFPTSSQANPTLTAVALALRLAEHLSRQGGDGGRAPRSQGLTTER
ncbi:MAG: GMC oxidoreductase [Pigmentiphaga sp.]